MKLCDTITRLVGLDILVQILGKYFEMSMKISPVTDEIVLALNSIKRVSQRYDYRVEPIFVGSKKHVGDHVEVV